MNERNLSDGCAVGRFERRTRGERVFTVTTRFDADLLGWFRSDRFEVVSLLEAASFDRCDAVDTDGARQTAEQLKRLADLFEAQQNEH